MFLSFFIPVGVFLLIAARRPSEHRSMIALAAWWNISHGGVMAIQTVEAWIHGVHRNFTDVIVFFVIGVVLLALLPAKREAVTPGVARTSAETPHVFFSRFFPEGMTVVAPRPAPLGPTSPTFSPGFN
jgi:peptidoglycan/LPS O-acetylase OafA/YrhL